MLWPTTPVAVLSLAVLVNCSRPPAQPVEDLAGGQDVSGFVLTTIKGTRDGDRLDVHVAYGDGSRQILVDLHFRITPPTRLESGTWSGLGGQGTVRERSVTFLGGQSGPPSIGGRFDLVGPDDRALYRISIPVQPLTDRL